MLSAQQARSVRTFCRDVFAYVLPLDVATDFDTDAMSQDDAIEMAIASPLTEAQSLALACYLHAIRLIEPEAKARADLILEYIPLLPEQTAAIPAAIERALRQNRPTPGDLIAHPPPAVLQAVEQLVVAQFGQTVEKVRLRGVTPADVQHPAEVSGLASLNRVPGVAQAIAALGDFAKRSSELTIHADGLVVNERSQPTLYRCYQETAKTLGLDNPPPLYMHGTGFHLQTLGVEDPAITVPSMVGSFFELPEISFLFGRELGHLIADHLRFRAAAQAAVKMGDVAAGIGPFFSVPLDLLMNNKFHVWMRGSELTADRCGLLACQDIEACLRALMKSTGYPLRYAAEINTAALVEQAENYQERISDSSIDRRLAWYNGIGRDNNYTVVRTHELLKWMRSGDYNTILRIRKLGAH
jgi:hypothetical protein